MADRTGLTEAFSDTLVGLRERRSDHDPAGCWPISRSCSLIAAGPSVTSRCCGTSRWSSLV